MPSNSYSRMISAKSLVILLAILLRLPLAPYSAGSDVPQFAGFADTLKASGLCFYVQAMLPRGEPWPYPWLFPYGPPLLLLLGLLRVLAPSPVTYGWVDGTYLVLVPADWRIAYKVTVALLDVLVVLLIYECVVRATGSRRKALGAAGIYAVSPMALYNSAIYGMFDHIALALLLTSMLLWDRSIYSGLLAGFAVMVKPTLLFPVLGLGLYRLSNGKRGDAVKWVVGALAALTLILAPFTITCPQSIPALINTFLWRGSPHYTLPLVYSLNGPASLATYYHLITGADTLWILRLWPLYTALVIVPLSLATPKLGSPYLVASAWYSVFMAFFWGVNPQFLVPLMGLYLVSLMEYNPRSPLGIVLILGVAWIQVWALSYPLSFWFTVHISTPNETLIELLNLLTPVIGVGDRGYTVYSMILFVLELEAIFCSILMARNARE